MGRLHSGAGPVVLGDYLVNVQYFQAPYVV
jgi:hypothetical protein